MTDPQSIQLPRRKADSHKGTYGRVLVVGGSRGMSGAIALTAMATLRAGEGLVRVATADCCLETVAQFEPSYMTAGLPHDEAGRIAFSAKSRLAELLEQSNCVGCGPGLGKSEEVTQLIEWLYGECRLPMVLDADALNALASRRELLESPGGPRILTPHPGEFSRLAGRLSDSGEERAAAAAELARRCRLVVVLKGHRTVVTDGERTVFNETGNPGMATGGTGDVLTGIVTALWAQGLAPFDAARLAVHLHGLAGDLAAARLGETSLIARDLLDFLPLAFQQGCVWPRG
jgi:ADP-dependent NAD(P)H-hydrate dehydratase